MARVLLHKITYSLEELLTQYDLPLAAAIMTNLPSAMIIDIDLNGDSGENSDFGSAMFDAVAAKCGIDPISFEHEFLSGGILPIDESHKIADDVVKYLYDGKAGDQGGDYNQTVSIGFEPTGDSLVMICNFGAYSGQRDCVGAPGVITWDPCFMADHAPTIARKSFATPDYRAT